MVVTLLAGSASDWEQACVMRNNLPRLLDALGSSAFGDELLRFLKEISGTEYVHFYQMINGRPQVLRAISLDGSGQAEQQADFYLSHKLFSVDPWVAEWLESPSQLPALFHVNRMAVSGMEMRNYYDTMGVSDRIMVCGPGEGGIFGISLAKSRKEGPFSEERERLEIIRDLALPLFIKHRDFCWQRTKLSRELLDVVEIERNMDCAPEKLARREIQVGARILRGFTASGIALDLGIGRETVICYRKRLYEKLEVGSYHDLLSWYMEHTGKKDISIN